MKKLAFAAILFLAPFGAFADGWNIHAMNRQIDQTNFLVNDNCSATLIDAKHGLLLTANHCVEAQFRTIEREKIDDNGVVTKETVRVSVPGTVSQLAFNGPDEVQRTSYVFKVKANDKDVDLALVQTQAKLPNADSAPIACSNVERGDTAYAVGNTRAILYATVSKGIISSLNRSYRTIGEDGANADNGLVQSTTPIAGGNSGGSLYNDRGEIVGVVVRGYQQVAPLGLSVPLSDIKAFLKANGAGDLFARCVD
jgi:S1-C subfamily serine protease